MRIVQVVSRAQRRGAEIAAMDLARELRRRDHHVEVWFLYGDKEPEMLELAPEDRLFRGRARHPLERFPGFHPGLLGRLRAAFREARPDIVQVNGSRTVKYGSLLRRLEKGPSWALVYRNIGNPGDWIGASWRRRLYSRLVVSRADGVVASSRATLENVESCYRIGVPRAVVPRGIDERTLAPKRTAREVRAATGTPEECPVVVSVGSLTHEKRPDRLLRIFRSALDAGTAAHLWILGEGPLRAAGESLAADLGVSERVRWVGLTPDVGDYLGAADLFVLTSDTEGTPGALLEAAVSGLPVLATRVGGVAECVDEGRTALLFDAGDEAGFAEALRDLLGDPERRREMGRRAAAWTTERFHITEIASLHEAFYQSVLDLRRSAAST